MTLVEEAVDAGARRDSDDQRCGPRTSPANKLSSAERRRLLAVANTPEYRDLSPQQIVPRLADEQGLYLASESTLYRLLREEKQMAHRQPSRPATATRPREQVATGPNQVWTWDISWLPGPVRGTFFYLYLMLDVWSRKIVGAVVHEEESSHLASQLFVTSCWRWGGWTRRVWCCTRTTAAP